MTSFGGHERENTDCVGWGHGCRSSYVFIHVNDFWGDGTKDSVGSGYTCKVAPYFIPM